MTTRRQDFSEAPSVNSVRKTIKRTRERGINSPRRWELSRVDQLFQRRHLEGVIEELRGPPSCLESDGASKTRPTRLHRLIRPGESQNSSRLTVTGAGEYAFLKGIT